MYKSKFIEMSFTRKEIENEIRHTNRNRRIHLILFYLFRKSRDRNKWQGEVFANLDKIADLKWSNNKKYLNENEYFNNLWVKPYENEDNYLIIDTTIENLKGDYPIPSTWKNYKKDIIKFLKEFYKEVSKMIANGSMLKSSIYHLLDKMFPVR